MTAIGIGTGGMGLQGRDGRSAIAGLHAALDAGVRTFDTARVYTTAEHPGYGEELLAEALATHPAGAEAFVITKGGHYRDGDDFLLDGSPEAIRRDFELSREHLGGRVDLYLLHAPDPRVPVGRTMEAFAALLDEGAVARVGVDSVTVGELREAMSVVPVSAVEKQYSPFAQADRELLDFCTANSIAFLAHSPRQGRIAALGAPGLADLERCFPRSAELAAEKGVTMTRLALAWLLTRSPRLIVISGASRPDTIRDSAGAAGLELSDEDLARVDFDLGAADLVLERE